MLSRELTESVNLFNLQKGTGTFSAAEEPTVVPFLCLCLDIISYLNRTVRSPLELALVTSKLLMICLIVELSAISCTRSVGP